MRFLPLITWLLFSSLLCGQAEWPKPKWEKVEKLRCPARGEQTITVGNYRVRLVHAQGKHACAAYLVDRADKEIPLLEGPQVSIYEGTGDDVFGDGSPSLILEEFSGRSAPRYTYRIVSLREPPVVLPAIENEAPFYFFKDPASHAYRVMTGDGGFHNFDGRCFDCSPFPRIVLRVENDGLHDVSTDFTEQYDSEIAVARAKIADGEMTKFMEADFRDARNVALEIVFAYLYSGRQREAWETLDRMWPAKDRRRIEDLIVETRSQGMLSRLAMTTPQ